MVIEELVASLGFKTENMGAARGFIASVNSIDKQMAAFGRTIRNVTVSMGAYFALKNAVWTGLGVKGVIAASAEWEVLERRLKSIVGTNEEVAKSMKYIEDFALKTPFGIAQSAEAFVKARGYGFSEEDTKKLMEGLADTSFAMGKDLMMGVEAAADAVRGDFRRFREFYSMAWDAQSEEGFVTFFPMIAGKEQKVRVKKEFKEIFEFLDWYMEEKFKGAATESIGSWTQMWDRMGDLFERFKRRIGQAGFFKFITDRLSRIVNYILDNDDVFNSWAKSVSDFYVKVIKGSEDFFLHMRDNVNYIREQWEKNEEVLHKIVVALGIVAVATRPFLRLVAQIAFFFLMIDDFLSYKQGKPSVFGKLVDWFTKMFDLKKPKAENVVKFLYGLAAIIAIFAPAIIGGAITAVLTAAFGLLGSPLVLLAFMVAAGAAVLAFLKHFRSKLISDEKWEQMKTDIDKTLEEWKDVAFEKGKDFASSLLKGLYDWFLNPESWKLVEETFRKKILNMLFGWSPFGIPGGNPLGKHINRAIGGAIRGNKYTNPGVSESFGAPSISLPSWLGGSNEKPPPKGKHGHANVGNVTKRQAAAYDGDYGLAADHLNVDTSDEAFSLIKDISGWIENYNGSRLQNQALDWPGNRSNIQNNNITNNVKIEGQGEKAGKEAAGVIMDSTKEIPTRTAAEPQL